MVRGPCPAVPPIAEDSCVTMQSGEVLGPFCFFGGIFLKVRWSLLQRLVNAPLTLLYKTAVRHLIRKNTTNLYHMLLFSSYLHLKVQLNFNVKLDFIQMMNGLRGGGKMDVPPYQMSWVWGFFFPLFGEKKKEMRAGDAFIPPCTVVQPAHTFPPIPCMALCWFCVPQA